MPHMCRAIRGDLWDADLLRRPMPEASVQHFAQA